MMRTLRKKMSLFLWFAAIAFILFIFLQWGMNVSGRKNGAKIANIIAKVNGISIPTQIYRQKENEILNRVRDSQNLNYITPLTRRIAEENAFNELTQDAILKNMMRKNHISVSENEIKEIIKNSPPPEIMNDSTMYTNGKFDPQKYLQVLLNPANRYWLYEHEKQIRQTYPYQKLNLLYGAGLKVTQLEVLKFYQEESLKVRVRYIPFRIEDYLNSINVTENDLRDYYAVHKEEYQTKRGAKLKAISFEVKSTLTDEMEAKREIDDIYNLYNSGMNFDTLAVTYSQDGETNKNGGDLGYVKKGDLPEEMEKVIFSLKKGEVSKPFKSSFGWEIVKVKDVKKNQRKVSRILIKILPGYETISSVRTKVDNFIKQAKDEGFTNTAKAFSRTVTEVTLYKDNQDVVPKLGKIIGVSNYFFSHNIKENTIAGPFVGYDDNLYVFLLENYIEPRTKTIDEIKETLTDKVKREKALDIAKEDAQKCFEEIKNGKSLGSAASNFGKKIITTKFFSMKDFIIGVPYYSEFYGLAFTLKEGDIGLANTKKGAFIIQVIKRKDISKDKFKTAAGPIIVNLFRTKKNIILSYWYKKMRDDSKLKDYRYQIGIY